MITYAEMVELGRKRMEEAQRQHEEEWARRQQLNTAVANLAITLMDLKLATYRNNPVGDANMELKITEEVFDKLPMLCEADREIICKAFKESYEARGFSVSSFGANVHCPGYNSVHTKKYITYTLGPPA